MTASQENYSLRWNNHQSHILKSFDALKNSESLVDVTLVCSDRSLRAHKVVLSACSPFFEKVFNDTPCKHPVIVLKDFRGWIVQAIVNFMYRGEISVTQGKLDQLIKAGESLQIRGLVGAVPFTVPIETDISAVREGCTSPMPRRKQARPRRRSEELELPQDLSNGTAVTKENPHSESEDEGCEKDEFSVSKRFKREIGLRDEVKSCDEIKRFDDDVIEGEEKENHPRDHLADTPENLSMKRAIDSSTENLAGDRNNNNNSDEKKRSADQQNDFHERFILSLKDLKHLRQRQGPSTHPFSDILSQLPITPPHSFHMNHLESKEAHNMKGDSDQSDGESAPFAEQLDLMHRNNLNSNIEKMSRERQRHQPNSGMPFPPHFHPGNDGQMRPSVHHGHSSSPLSFPSMSSGLTLTPPHSKYTDK
jgi:BTB/POZ domain